LSFIWIDSGGILVDFKKASGEELLTVCSGASFKMLFAKLYTLTGNFD
jgi:hypothetical protein